MVKNSRQKALLANIYRKLHSSFGPQHWWPGETRLEVIVGAVLTQNTNWGNVEKALNNLKKEKKLTFTALKKITHSQLADLIRPSGYFNIKAKRLKNLISFIDKAYGGSLKRMSKRPRDILREELLSVNGVGEETADSILLYAFDKPVFVVDAYTKRIFYRHGLAEKEAGYKELQDLFSENLKDDVQMFNEYHAFIVNLGKNFCRPKAACEQCPLNRAKYFLEDNR